MFISTSFQKVKILPSRHFNCSKINFNLIKTINRNQHFCKPQCIINKYCISKKSTQSGADQKEECYPTNNNNNVDKVVNFYGRRYELHCKSKNKGVSLAIVGGGHTTVSMAMLLKQNPSLKEIRLIDTDNSLLDVVCDIRQIDTSTAIRHFKINSLFDGLRDIDIVALMDETHFALGNKGPFLQFVNSCNYVKNVVECMINACPKALVAVFVHPVTATLPLVSEIYKYSGDWDPNRIVGSAGLESMRMSALTASLLDLNPSCVSVPIAGGVDPLTVVPLLSRARPFSSFTQANEMLLIHQLRSADVKLFQTGTKDPTLSNGMAAAKFISTMVNGMRNESISITSAYIRSDVLPICQYMTSEVQFGPEGVQINFGLPKVSSTEICMIEQAAQIIKKITKTATRSLHTGQIK